MRPEHLAPLFAPVAIGVLVALVIGLRAWWRKRR